MSGCMDKTRSSISAMFDSITRKPQHSHTVRKGDTLYSIAKRYNVNAKEMVSLNRLNDPGHLKVGQRLKIPQLTQSPPKVVKAKSKPAYHPKYQQQQDKSKSAPVKSIGMMAKNGAATTTASDSTKSSNQTTATSRASTNKKPVTTTKSTTPSKQNTRRYKVRTANALKWQWPNGGKVLDTYFEGLSKGRGIQIYSQAGSPVKAAASGQVVYSGSALRGYGNLIILKHSKNFLTAYAHNRKLMVKEGESVQIGQQIAEMGQSGTNKVKLHFEVRHQGKPIDPMRVLPKK